MRKKILPIIITLLALCSTKAFATDYDLWVAGVRVTSSNASHITGSGISGSVSYNYSTNTLTLNGATITSSSSGVCGVMSYIDDLTIQLTGNNSISTVGSQGIFTDTDMTLQGTGKLIVNTADFTAIVTGGDLTINDCTIEARSNSIANNVSYYGIYGDGNTLTIKGAFLTACGYGGSGYPIFGFDHLNMTDGTTLVSPYTAFYDEAFKRLSSMIGAAIVGEAIFENINHCLWVAGHQLEGSSGTYTFTGSNITGDVSYNYSTNTLTLNGATISATMWTCGIESKIPDLKIKLIGDNSIGTVSQYGINARSDMTLQGTGKLTISSADSHAVNAEGNLTINNCIVKALSIYSSNNNFYGIKGASGKTLTINGGTLLARGCGSSGYPIYGFGHLNTTGGTTLVSPSTAFYDEAFKRLSSMIGVAIVGEAIFGNNSLWVAGQKLEGSSGTYDFINSDITSGIVKYNPSTNTLTLNGATITSSHGIESYIPNLKIQLIGNNSISTANHQGIDAGADMTLQGTGKLTINSTNSNAIQTTGKLTINNCTVEARVVSSLNTSFGGIRGASGKTLTVNEGFLTAEGYGSMGYPIYGFGHLSMAGGDNISYPANAHYDQTDQRIEYSDGSAVIGEAIISQNGLWVAGHQLGGSSGTYTFNGLGIGVDGDVSYNYNTNTLTLFLADITTTGDTFGIENHIPGLIIDVAGNCNISAESYGIYSDVDMTIQESGGWAGNLTVTSIDNDGIYTEGNLTINDCSVDASNINSTFGSLSYYGIRGASSKTLAINGGTLTATGSWITEPIYGFGHLSMTGGVTISQPANVHYDETDKRLEYSNGIIVFGTAIIGYPDYDLFVAGHPLNGSSSTCTFTGTGISGTVSYSYITNTLTLDNATITASGHNYGIETNIPNLKIQLIGNNNITTVFGEGILSDENITLQGSGKLSINTFGYYCINTTGNLTINGCVVEAATEADALASVHGSSDKTLNVNGGVLTANCGDASPIDGFGHLCLSGVSITNPGNAHYDEYDKRLEYADQTLVVNKVAIEAVNHQLWVAGHQLGGSSGTYNFTGSGINPGIEASYNYSTNTLSFFTSSVTATGNTYGIENHIPGLIIDVTGMCSISAESYGIYSDVDMTIQESRVWGGYLIVTSSDNDGIYTKGNFTIEGCSVEARNIAPGSNPYLYNGISGTSDKSLTINDGALKADGGAFCEPIYGFGHLNMSGGVTISQPANAYYSETHLRLEFPNGSGVLGTAVLKFARYDLWVDGTQVTSANATDILGNGKVSYDAATNTLTLNGAYIYSSEHEGIRNGIDGLKINLEGNSQITSTVAEGILSEQNAALTIQGSGNLVVKGTTGIGVNKSLTITGGCRVDAESSGRFANSAIEGYMDNSTFTVNASTVIARSERTTQGIIYGFGTFSCTGNAGITYPTGAHWSNTHHRIEDSDDLMLTGAVTISSATYNLYVKDIQVTNGNRDDVLGDGGSVSYNPSSCTLTLNNANITNTGTDRDGIRNSINGLKINLVGSSTITAGRYGVQMGAANTTFTGNGSLSINAQYGLYSSSSSGHTLTLSVGCHLNIEASAYGIRYGNGTLSIDRAELRVKGGSSYASIMCNALNLTEVSIMSPEGATFSNGYVRYANNNIVADDYVVIGAQPYNLYVKGVQVSPVNRDDILGDGHASYDPGSNTLILNNATVEVSGNYGIRNEIAGLTIKLIGANSINASNSGIYSSKDFTIEGSSTDVLNVSGSDGIYAYSCNLTIRGGCNVTATGKTNSTSYSGIYGSSSKTFRIINSSVTAQKQAPSSGSIVGYPIAGFQPQITGCTISPTGMSWSNGHYVDGNGTAVTDPIVIAPIYYYIDVAGIRVTSANCNDIFADSTRFHPATVSYDPASDILTLNDARISTSAYGIINARPGLKINVVGYCSITSSGAMGIYTNKFLVIQGTGELRVQGITGIRADNCDLTIKDIPEIEVYGTWGSGYGCIYGYPGYSLTINRSHLIARSGNNLSYSAIYGFSNLNFTDNKVQFIQPSDGTYSSRSVYSGGSVYKGEVEIDGMPYGFRIDGMEVTTANCENFTYGVESGTISYDNTNHTLTLDNAVFGPTTLGDDAIENYDLETFRIQLIGDNLITHCGEGMAIRTFALEQGDGTFFTIMGPGTLVCEGEMEVRGEGEGHDQGQCVFSIVDDADVCMANNATINSYANSSLIDLEVANSTLRAYQITGLKVFNDFPSSNAYVDAPDGADFSYSVGNGSIALNGAVAEDVVIITDYQLCVAGVWVTSLNAHDIRSEYLTSGTASYDFASHTLTLNNVNIVMEDDDNVLGNGIYSTRDFNIELIGENSIASANNDGIYCWDGLHILGPGSLSVQGINGIRQHTFASHDFELSGSCSVNVVSTGSGDCAALKGNNRALLISSGCQLFAQNSSLSNYSPVYGFNDLQLVGVEILQPWGAVYSTSHKRIEDEQGNLLNAPVEIGYVEYDLWICDEQVTSANVNSLSSLAGVSGNVSFNRSTNTLTLDNATLNADDADSWLAIKNAIDGLTISLIGSNRIEVDAGNGILVNNANTTITGSGTLDLEVEQFGISFDGADYNLFTIENGCTVTIECDDEGFYSARGTLRIDGATLDITKCSNTEPIYSYGFDLVGVEVTTPVDGYVSGNYVVDANGNHALGHVVIEPIRYDLWVAGTRVTAINAEDVLGDGKVSYDAENNIITLNEATISNAGETYTIKSYIDGLDIFLIGENIIEEGSTNGIQLYADATINGTGSLKIYTQYGIWAYAHDGVYPSLTLSDGCSVYVECVYGGVYLGWEYQTMSGGVLTINGSTLEVEAGNGSCEDALLNCLALNLNDTEIVEPYHAEFRNYAIYEGSNEVKDYILIELIKYDLWVAGVQVTATNANNVLGDGKVSYDAVRNMLVLNGATIEYLGSGHDGITTNMKDLTIGLLGDNYITAGSCGIKIGNILHCTMNIVGPGTLFASGSNGILCSSSANSTLTIAEAATVVIDGSSTGVSIGDFDLVVNGATLWAKGVYASLKCKSLTMIGTSITAPEGAVFSPTLSGVIENAAADDLFKGDYVKITPDMYPLWITDTQVTSANAARILGDGSVSYDAESNTLTLNEATIITTTDISGIDTYIDNLNIVLEGNNSIETLGGAGITLQADATISGTGRLDVNARYGICGYDDYLDDLPSLTLEGGCQVIIVASEDAVYMAEGRLNVGAVLTVDNSTLDVTKEDLLYTAIKCRLLVLNGCEVTDPEEYHFTDFYCDLVNSNGEKPNHVLIEPCNVFTGTDGHDWENPANWSKNELPLATSKVYVAAPCISNDDVEVKEIVIEETGSMNLINGTVLTVEAIVNSDASRFVITNGQLYCDNEVPGTFHKTVTMADADENGWNAIAVPMNNPSIANLTANIYDIYFYDEDADQNEWQNYKDNSFSFVPGQGYLYANSAVTDLAMAGTFKPSNQTVIIALSYGAQYEGIRGFNLVGNPYPRKLSMNEIKIDGVAITEYYRLVEDTNGSEFVRCTSGDILPGEGFFIKATAAGQTLTIGGE